MADGFAFAALHPADAAALLRCQPAPEIVGREVHKAAELGLHLRVRHDRFGALRFGAEPDFVLAGALWDGAFLPPDRPADA